MASTKKRLGRGLDALMGGADVQEPVVKETKKAHAEPVEKTEKKTSKKSSLPKGIESDENGTLWVDPKLLKPNPHQPRKVFNEEQLAELSASIKEQGVVEPIVIQDAEDGSFYIIAGERRTRASIMAGLEKVPVQLRKYNEEKQLEIALIENIQREDLNPIEEAQAYFNLMKLGGLNQEEVAKKVGKGRPTVANALRLLKLPEDMQTALVAGQITSGHARALLAVLNPADQRVLFGKIISGNLSVRQAEASAQELNDGGRASKGTEKKPSKAKNPDIADLEQKFIEALGTKVEIKGDMKKGSLVVEYFSGDDLDRLYSIIVKN